LGVRLGGGALIILGEDFSPVDALKKYRVTRSIGIDGGD
jgi:hypothetical protein